MNIIHFGVDGIAPGKNDPKEALRRVQLRQNTPFGRALFFIGKWQATEKF
jgi:hypothetical protein